MGFNKRKQYNIRCQGQDGHASEDATKDIAYINKCDFLRARVVKVYSDCIGLKLGINTERRDEISKELKYLANYIAHTLYLTLIKIDVMYEGDRLANIFKELEQNGIYNATCRFSRYNVIENLVRSINDNINNSIYNFSNIELFLEILNPQKEWNKMSEDYKYDVRPFGIISLNDSRNRKLFDIAKKSKDVAEDFEHFHSISSAVVDIAPSGFNLNNKCLKNILDCINHIYYTTMGLNVIAEDLSKALEASQELGKGHDVLCDKVSELFEGVKCFLPDPKTRQKAVDAASNCYKPSEVESNSMEKSSSSLLSLLVDKATKEEVLGENSISEPENISCVLL